MEDQYICRRNDDNNAWSLYEYPFSELCKLRFESHIHPEFVIFHVGSKMERWSDEFTLKLNNDYPSLWMISLLYRAWTRDVPLQAKDDKSYIVPGDEQDDY